MKARLKTKLESTFDKPSDVRDVLDDNSNVYRFFLTPKYFTPNMSSLHERAVMLDAIKEVSKQPLYENKYKEVIEEYEIKMEGLPEMPGSVEFQENLEPGDATNVAKVVFFNKAYQQAVGNIEETISVPDVVKMKKLEEINKQQEKQWQVMQEREGTEEKESSVEAQKIKEIPEKYKDLQTRKKPVVKKYQKKPLYKKEVVGEPVFYTQKEETKTEQEPFIYQESSHEAQHTAYLAKKENSKRFRARREVLKIYESSDEEINGKTEKNESPKK
jgi:hypothetical protein